MVLPVFKNLSLEQFYPTEHILLIEGGITGDHEIKYLEYPPKPPIMVIELLTQKKKEEG